MKVSSKKNKARLLQQYVAKKIIEYFPGLEEADVRSASMGQTGADILLSPRAREAFPYNVECKAHERFAVYEMYDQAVSHGDDTPLLVVKANHRRPLVVLDLDDLFRIIKT